MSKLYCRVMTNSVVFSVIWFIYTRAVYIKRICTYSLEEREQSKDLNKFQAKIRKLTEWHNKCLDRIEGDR